VTRLRPHIVIVVIVLASWLDAPPAWSQGAGGFEPDPVFQASQLVQPQLLKGENFTLDPKVPVRGFMEVFTIHSAFGDILVAGRDLLPVRVGEIPAIAELSNTTKSGAFLKAAGQATAKPVMAAANMVTHPVDTAKGMPAAVGRFFDRVELGAKKIADSGEGPPPKEGVDFAAEAGKRVGMSVINVLGYEQERRKLAKQLSVDPYTTNPLLAAKLDDVAWVAFSGRFAVNTTMSVLMPFSMAVSATSIANDMVWDTPPADLINLNGKKLLAMGASETQVRMLLRNQFYSLTVLTAFVTALEQLGGVSGRNTVISFAAGASSETQARLISGATQLLVRYHKGAEPLKQVTGSGPIVARTGSGALLIAAPVDYVTWNQRLSTFRNRADLKAPTRIAWITGRFSPRAAKEMQAAGWKLREGQDPGGK